MALLWSLGEYHNTYHHGTRLVGTLFPYETCCCSELYIPLDVLCPYTYYCCLQRATYYCVVDSFIEFKGIDHDKRKGDGKK